jgi:hypothetical protein
MEAALHHHTGSYALTPMQPYYNYFKPQKGNSHLLFSLRVQRGIPRESACSLVRSEVGMHTMSFSSPDFN